MASAASRFIAAGALVCPYSRVYGDKGVLYLRLWGFLSRKDNKKYRPLRLAAADGDAAAQIFRQLPNDGQSQTVALGRAAALIAPVEAVEHMGQGFGRDHRPPVLHRQPGLPPDSGQRHGDAAADGLVFDGVLYQTGDDALQRVRAALHGDMRRDVRLQRHLLVVGHRLQL